MEISPTYVKKTDCLNCKEKFTTTKIRSRFVRVTKHESDLKPIYTDPTINPILYNVAVCPSCGFAYTDEFSSYFAPGVKDEITQMITSRWSGRSFGDERTTDEAIEAYKLCLSKCECEEREVIDELQALRFASLGSMMTWRTSRLGSDSGQYHEICIQKRIPPEITPERKCPRRECCI